MDESLSRRYSFHVFTVDFARACLLCEGKEVKLRPKSFETFKYLFENRGRLVTKEELMQAVWPDSFVTEDSLVKVVKDVRRALEGDAHHFIKTVPRRGYIFDVGEEIGELAPNSGTSSTTPPAPIPQKMISGRLWFMFALGGLVLALGATVWWWVQYRNEPLTIAVLPLDNLSHDPADDYFADGLTDEIIHNLSVIEGLAVRSRTSSFVLKGQPRNVRDAGKQLQVNYILEGSVLRMGSQLRVNIQLVRVRDDLPLWSGKFDRLLTDVFVIQDEISHGIVNNLRLKLGQGRRRYETSVEAYDLYLRALAARGQPALGIDPRLRLFKEVIAKDPSFAPAYAGLAEHYARQSVMYVVDHPDDELPSMRAVAEKAIQLDPLLAEAHAALAMVYAREGQWQQSEKSFRRAIELDPNSSSPYVDYAYSFLMVLSRLDEALQQARFAQKVDPLSPRVQRLLADALISAGQYDEAVDYCQRLPADAGFKNVFLGRARLGQGRAAEAVRLVADHQTSPNPLMRGFVGHVYARSGRGQEAEKMAAASEYANEQALIFAGLGDRDRALEALNRMAAVGPQRIGQFLSYPELAILRDDPRLKAFRRKIGLPE
jgi:TolB-like protein/DNA-binding winged helix-turn-helix (wHTH) protein